MRVRAEIKRTADILERPARHGVRIDHRGSHVAVPKPLLYRPYVDVRLQQMTGKCMTERMRGHTLGDARRIRRRFYRSLDIRIEHMIAPIFTLGLDK